MKNGKIYSKKLLSLVLVICLMPLMVINPVQVGASEEYSIVKDVLWDIDFEDETLDFSGSPYVTVCSSDGLALHSTRGDIFRCHTGSSDNTITISDGVMCLKPSNTTEYVQTNEFFTSLSGGAAVFRYRVMVEDYKTSKYVFRLVYSDSEGTTYWTPQLYIKQNVSILANLGYQDTSFAVKDGTDSSSFDVNTTVPCKKNTWYTVEATVNLEDNTFLYKVDGSTIASGTLGKDIITADRISIAPEIGEPDAQPSSLYIDDIYVYEATNEPYAILNLSIDGKATNRLYSGNLTASAQISNGYGNIDCVFALYEGNKLSNVKWLSSVSDGTKWTQTEEVELGGVDETMELKMIIADSESKVKPIGKCIVADKHGLSSALIDTATLKTIFESEEATKSFLSGKTGYHPDSGYITIDGSKTETGLTGEVKDGVCYVPVSLFTYFGANVQDGADGTATVNGYLFSGGLATATSGGVTVALSGSAWSKDGTVYVPLVDTVQKIMGKHIAVTQSGKCHGAAVISDSAFTLPDDETALQKLNYYLLYKRPDATEILKDYKASEVLGVHPRVIMTASDFDRIKNATDSVTSAKKARIISHADNFLLEPTLKYELRDGVRLWYVSMDFMDKVMALSFAYKLTGNKAYLNKCIAEMDSIAAFPDWHPEHHIDVGGLAVGFAVGYDWLYHDLTDAKRASYEAAVYKLCFDQYYKGFTDVSDYMKGGILANNNHNSVMNSGITMCALAFMDIFPDEGAYFIANSLRATERTVHNFFPDGAWYEGVGYGCMTLEYMALQLSAVHNAFGTLYGIDKTKGMEDAARFLVNMQSPTGAFAFYDGGGTNVQWHSGALWFAEHFGTTDVVHQWNRFYNIGEEARADVACLMYYNPESAKIKSKTEVRWDVDFENVYAGEHRWKYPYVSIFSANGSELSSSGDTLTAHTGTTANSISTLNTKNSAHGKALRLKATDSSEVQLNEFLTSVSGDVIDFEYDYMIESLPTTGSASTINVMHIVMDGNIWLNPLNISIENSGVYLSASGKKTEISNGTWYKIRGSVDTNAKKLSYYIDGKYFASEAYQGYASMGKKVVSKLNNAPGAVVWVDNFKVSAQTFDSSVDFGDKDVYYEVNDVITMRDSRISDNPVFAGAKGGFAADDHGHMDMGTFCFFANGVKWLGIHGSADYNLPNFWSGGSRESARWSYFTMRAESHNCLVINPDQYGEYDPNAKAKFTRFETGDDSAIAVLDMTDVHAGKATDAKRGYFFTDNRQSLVVRDEVKLSGESEVYFFLITDHNVTIDGNKAIFTDKDGSGSTLTAEFVCDTEFTLTAGEAKPLATSPDPDSNPSLDGATRVSLRANVSDSINITVKLTPSGVSGSGISEYDKAISQWTI
ncbi:MAG: heparinase II/III family protein [Clostridia bacterium]|nr:heparinase II/III family protein [Clostridia bacterium]